MSQLQVGKLAVCVKSHHQGCIKAGDIKELLGIRKMTCGCIVVNVGIPDPHLIGELLKEKCSYNKHGFSGKELISDGYWWLAAERFVPIEDLSTEQVDELLDSILQNKEIEQI